MKFKWRKQTSTILVFKAKKWGKVKIKSKLKSNTDLKSQHANYTPLMFFPTDEARFFVRKELYDQEHTALRHICPINGSGFRETKQDLAVKYGDSN